MTTTPKNQSAPELPEAPYEYMIGELRKAREYRGMSVAELARRSLMNGSHLGKALRGERVLRGDELLRVCYALDVRPGAPLVPGEVIDELERRNHRKERRR